MIFLTERSHCYTPTCKCKILGFTRSIRRSGYISLTCSLRSTFPESESESESFGVNLVESESESESFGVNLVE